MNTREFRDLDPLLYAKRLPYSRKIANNFAWAKNCADAFDFGMIGRDDKESKLRKDLYRIWNGRGSDAVQAESTSPMSADLMEEGFEGSFAKVQHYDIISQIGHAMHGEQIARPLQAFVIDKSAHSQSERRAKREELITNYLQEKFIKPAQEQAMMQVMQQMGIQDPFSLQPEEQQQFQQQVDQVASSLTLPDIQKYLRKGYRTTREKQGNKLLQVLLKELDIKFKGDYNFQNVIIDGSEVYRVGVRHSRPFVDIINPLKFRWGGGSDVIFIQDGEWAIYEQDITIADAYNKYGDVLTKADLKRLDNYVGLGSNSMKTIEEFNNSRLIASVGFDTLKSEISKLDMRTSEGQNKFKAIQHRLNNHSSNFAQLREVHIVWKAQRRLKQITRVNEDGTDYTFFIDESYKFNPFKGDIKQSDIWVNEVWEVTKIGFGTEAIYLNIGPVPFQYRSLSNPRDVKLPYIGAEYFRLMGNDKNTSPLRKGLAWQHDINIEMAKIRELDSTDLGKVLLMTMAAKPDNWTWGKFFQVVRYTKMAPIDLKKEGIDAFDAQFFKSIDLSNMQDIAGKIQRLEWLINRAAMSMSFNAARLGQTQQYSTATNNQQNLARSLSQTASIYEMHDKILMQVLDAVIHAARVAFKDNPAYFVNILDDGEIAELELDNEMLWNSELGVYVTNSGDDQDNLQMVKQNLMHFIQNGLGLPESIRILWSKSGSELFSFAEEIEEKQQSAAQQQMEAMKEAQMSQAELAKEMEILKAELKQMLQREDLEVKLKMADINADNLRRANDINENNENDYLERQAITDEINMQKFMMEMQMKREMMRDQKELKEKELEIKEKQLKNRPIKRRKSG
jgi:hypothetical protein